MLTSKHLIAGAWVEGSGHFSNDPVSGEADQFSNGSPELVDQAVEAAEEAFWTYGYSDVSVRAGFLRAVADEIEALGAEITAQGMKETGLPEARLNGERGRTTGQLRMFADHIESGGFLDRRHDEALPDRAPLPRPDIRLLQRPVGPVAVFGASNFPLAFSTAGGDTAAALAAGCPVVVKGHPAHPGVGWAASLTMGAGQFCTNPGIAVVLDGADAFVEAATGALLAADPQVMLTDGIAAAYQEGTSRIAQADGVSCLLQTPSEGRSAAPNLFKVDAATWMKDESLQEEVFGPLAIVVEASSADEMRAVAARIEGQLTCTLHMDDGDTELARSLLPILERKAGRILANGFPTGVEVSDAMVHGGPYPASTNFGATSVGTLSIRRFLRPVSYQNVPEAILPSELKTVYGAVAGL